MIDMGEFAAGGGSFDLRDFISSATGAAELDESAPLSASDLRILLDRIHVRSDELKERVKQSLIENYDEFVRISRNADEAVWDVESVAEDVKKIVDSLGEREKADGAGKKKSVDGIKEQLAFDIEICELAAEAERLRKEQEERREYIAAVEFIAEVHGGIKTAESDFLAGNLIEAATELGEIRKQLELPADWTGDRDDEQEREQNREKVKAFTLLEDEWATCYSKLRRFLEDLFSKAVVLNARKFELCIYPSVSCSDSNVGVEVAEVQLSTILSAMDKVGVLDTRLAKAADALFKQIIDPIVREPGINLSSRDLSHGGQATLSWNPSMDKTDRAGITELYSKLLEIFKFLRFNMLVKNYDWMQRFGRVIWPQLADSIIVNCLRKAVPNETSELAEFQELAQLTADFETSLGDAGLIPEWDESQGDKLRNFSSDVELLFAIKKRKYIVAKVRDLLVHSDYKNFVIIEAEKTRQGSDESDDMSLLQTETCAITDSAKQLLELVHETLQDACNSSAVTAMELYHAARDALLLYRAIVPVKVMNQVKNVHEVAALCHTDCFYIAHNLLFLDFQYNMALPPEVQKVMSFVDLVPLFRRLGCDILEKQMRLIKMDIKQSLDQAMGFENTNQKRYYDYANNAITQAAKLVEEVRLVWQPILAASVSELILGKLVDSVISRLITEILTLEDISVEEDEQLRKLMLVALERLSLFFGEASGEVDGGVGSQSRNLVKKLVPSWRKLERLTDLLDMSLRPITQSWESGDLTSCGFLADEVQHLIKAIFSETPLRTECLKLIVNSHVEQKKSVS